MKRKDRCFVAHGSLDAVFGKHATDTLATSGWAYYKHAHDRPLLFEKRALWPRRPDIRNSADDLSSRLGNDKLAMFGKRGCIAQIFCERGPVGVVRRVLLKCGNSHRVDRRGVHRLKISDDSIHYV